MLSHDSAPSYLFMRACPMCKGTISVTNQTWFTFLFSEGKKREKETLLGSWNRVITGVKMTAEAVVF